MNAEFVGDKKPIYYDVEQRAEKDNVPNCGGQSVRDVLEANAAQLNDVVELFVGFGEVNFLIFGGWFVSRQRHLNRRQTLRTAVRKDALTLFGPRLFNCVANVFLHLSA